MNKRSTPQGRLDSLRRMSQAEQEPETEAEGIEADIDTVVAAFDGDLRAAIRSLLIANEFLNRELERVKESVSAGYSRRGRT